MKMFNLIDVGERAGSGIPNIFKVWEEQQWSLPVIEEKFNPERSTLFLYLTKSVGQKPTEKTDRKNRQKKPTEKIRDKRKKQIIDYLMGVDNSTVQEISNAIGLGITQTKGYLVELVKENLVGFKGKTKKRVYYRISN